ncbi:hypothetical protein A4A49_03430 [Nicotiana attenuata]|uniref:Retrotransposon gag domain-containing protein n=1 Tax=Nicotiana attenuata TaxID=49451 RepID=A0A314KZ68_NICAT|nr:hypothetical protein A4A49_03430 [Nicotiana attenuata]
MMANAQSSALETSVTESHQNQLALCPYRLPGKEIKTTSWDDSERELHNLRKIVEKEMRARNIQSLRYESLCMHPNVELPPGFKIPKFNTFNGKGNHISHLKDYCTRLVGIGHNEAIRMKLFIQSLSGIVLDWFTQQNFSKWYTWEDMAHDFVEQYKFNIRDIPTLCDMREVERRQHESFLEYAMRWRLEASKIRPQLPENELISTFIDMQKGIYYEKLLCARLHDFSDLVRVGKLIEASIRAGKIIDNSKLQATFQDETLENLQGKKRKIDSACITAHQPQSQQNSQLLQTHIQLQPTQQNVQHQAYQAQFSYRHLENLKFRTFIPLKESLTSIFERLKAKGLLQPREGWIPQNLPPDFDWSKTCAYHSYIQGHDTRECPTLKHKIQNMIENNEIIVQQEQPCNNYDPSVANTIVVKGNLSKLAPRPLKRKHEAKQDD